jgi:membrane protease YdiL (CAAX protease family)
MTFSNTRWKLTLGDDGVLIAGRFLWLRALAWAATLFAGALFLFFASISLGNWVHAPERANYVIALVVPCVAFIVYAMAVRTGERRRAEEVMLTNRSALELLVGAALGFGMISATLAILWLLGLYSVHLSHWSNTLSSFVFDSYISGMLEELAFRLILLRLLARAFGPAYGLIISSVLFGAAHLSHATWFAALEVAFNGGMIMGLLYMITGRIWMSVGMHIGWDFTEESLLGVNSKSGLLLSTPVSGHSDILTGGSYGPDASILAGIVGAILIAGIWSANARRASRSDILRMTR